MFVPVVEASGHLSKYLVCLLGSLDTLCTRLQALADHDTNIFFLSSLLKNLAPRGMATHSVVELMVVLSKVNHFAFSSIEGHLPGVGPLN